MTNTWKHTDTRRAGQGRNSRVAARRSGDEQPAIDVIDVPVDGNAGS
jgi:hypothetical protein